MRDPSDISILVACEESQEVTIRFRKRGFNAYSCDTQPCSGGHPEWHIQGDAKEIYLSRHNWGLVIAHPPCTYLSNSGALRLYRGGKKENGKDILRWHDMICGAAFFKFFVDGAKEFEIPTAIENPIMHGHSMAIIGDKHTQIIQPYNFGDDASKATCLWLYGLPKLENTGYAEPRIVNGKKRWSNQTDGGWNKEPPSKERGKIRSKTYPGIAEAMADQWGNYLLTNQTLFSETQGDIL